MNLLIDIGNTRTKLGVLAEDGRDDIDSVDTAGLEDVLRHRADLSSFDRIGVSSVVPDVQEDVVRLISGRTDRTPFVVSHRVGLPFEMAYRTPETLGNDRIAAAAGAWLEYRVDGAAVIVIDAGTAVTYEVVGLDGVYRGGAIAPGPGLMRASLHLGTAQLPDFEDFRMEGPVGTSTREAIQSGVQWGFLDSVAGMIRRCQAAVEVPGGEPARVVATGGWAPFIAGHVPDIQIVDPNLVLRGIARLMALNPE